MSSSHEHSTHAPEDQLPDWSEVDTPWDRAPIAWRLDSGVARNAGYAAQVEIPTNTHLVREVLVHRLPKRYETKSETPARTRGEAEDAIAETQKQFGYLESESHGLRVVPEVTWHILEPADRKLRVLARVAIVDGKLIPPKEQRFFKPLIEPYQRRIGLRILEFETPIQYLRGLPRTQNAVAGTYLVDVDPAYWARRRRKEKEK
jgi:hypothetical protein